MTLNQLKMWRLAVPFVIVSLCVLPWLLLTVDDLEDALRVNQLIVPVIAYIGAFFYVGVGLRNWHWKKEMDRYVGEQIRRGLLDMIPVDLEVSEGERKALAEREIFRKLTGVFWEAVDRDQHLVSHKQHFYSNGIIYSTSFDVYLICGFAGICYVVAFFVTKESALLIAGIGLVAIALLSRVLVTRRARKRHLELSSEQLDLLRRNQREFVSERFREIISEWRTSRVDAS